MEKRFKKHALELAVNGRDDELETFQDEIRNEFPDVVKAIERHISTYRFDLIVKLLQKDETP